jgi:hypothetical protein
MRRTLQLITVGLTIVLSSGFLVAHKENLTDRSRDETAQIPTIVIEVADQDSSRRADEPYRVGAELHVKVTANNQTDQVITVAVINEYAQNRPQLFKSGKLVPYRSGINKLAHSNEDELDLPRVLRTDYIPVQPYSSAEITVLDLKDWYGRLEPGSYRLTNRYRLTIGGQWSADSKAVSFEIAR